MSSASKFNQFLVNINEFCVRFAELDNQAVSALGMEVVMTHAQSGSQFTNERIMK